MKRILSFVIILVMGVSLAACTGQGGNTPDPTQAPTAAPTEWSAVVKITPEPTAAPTDEPAETPVPTAMPERPGDDPNAPKVFAGKDVFFILYPDGSLYGWGNNEYGQLGTGSTDPQTKPVHIANGLTPVIVGETVFAIGSSGTLWGWGRNDMGQLGTGDSENKTRPVEIMSFVKEIVPAWNSYYALTESGQVYGWGVMSGTEPSSDSYEPKLLFENVEYFTPYCMIKDGGELWLKRGDWMKVADGAVRVFDKRGFVTYVECEDGILYNINDQNELIPICDNVRDVQLSYDRAFILRNDGSLLSNELGGDGAELIMDCVVEILCDWEMDEDWGYNYNFALKANGELWAWSMLYSNELVGKSMENESLEPACVATNVKKVVTNNAQTFIIKEDGSVWATGLNSKDNEVFFFGGVGDGTSETKYGFVDLGLKGIVNIVSALTEMYFEYDDGTDGVVLYARTFAIDEEGRVWAWGYNGDGFLGVDSAEVDVLAPMEVLVTKE